VIGISLALPFGGYALLSNVESFSSHAPTEPQLSIFMARNAGKNDIATIEARLKNSDGVRAVRFIDRDAALTELKRSPEMADAVSSLKDNPLPDAFVVTLASNDPVLAERIEQSFRALPKVNRVQVDSAWVKRMNALLQLGRTSVILLGLFFSFALVAVVFNTIRLQIFTQLDEIEVSRMVGATRSYIRRPFVYLGALLGFGGGLSALLFVFLILIALNRDVARLAELYSSSFKLGFLSPAEWIAVPLIATFLGWVGAYLSVSRHLHEIDGK
jgi:cell division transport system permease protein